MVSDVLPNLTDSVIRVKIPCCIFMTMQTRQPAKTPRLLYVASCLGMEAARGCWGTERRRKRRRRRKKRRTTQHIQEEVSVNGNGISYNEQLQAMFPLGIHTLEKRVFLWQP